MVNRRVLAPGAAPQSIPLTEIEYDARIAEAIPTKTDLHKYLAQKRYEIEIGGLNAGGINVMTTRDARGLLRDAAEYLDDTDTRDFKTASGVWVNVTGAQLSAVWSAVEAHVDACFQTEKSVADKIESDDENIKITTFAEIDAEPWPSNN